MTGIALVAVEWHRRYLRRYVKLPIGGPSAFTCTGGWHEAIVEIGDYPGAIERGSPEEKQLAPPRVDDRWPMKCDRCLYRFTERDRYQLLTTPLRDLGDEDVA